MNAHVAVLMGGWSAEREVSLTSGEACARALRDAGYRISEIDVDRTVATTLTELRPDIAFNALHGRWGEDGCVQAILEVLQIPYTHSGVRASSVAMHKPTAKQVFARAGIPCPEGEVVSIDAARAGHVMAPPYVAKPTSEGSTVGVHIVNVGDNAGPVTDDWDFGDEVLVERFVPGRELSVAVMDDHALGVVEIRPHSGFYDYEAKYSDGKATHLMPAPIHANAYAQAMDFALKAHQAIGCRGVSRADFRYDDSDGEPGELYLLEINTQPGMTPLSLVPEIAAHSGMSFQELVCWMVEDAGCDR